VHPEKFLRICPGEGEGGGKGKGGILCSCDFSIGRTVGRTQPTHAAGTPCVAMVVVVVVVVV